MRPGKRSLTLKAAIAAAALMPALALSATHNVSTNSQLRNALSSASNGDTIVIAAGTYQPSSSLNTNTLSQANGGANRVVAPQFMLLNKSNITIRGASSSNRPTLKGTGITDGKYVFYAQKANGLTLKDIQFKNATKGVIIDRSDNVTINNIRVENIGNEGLHFRDGSDGGETKFSEFTKIGMDRKDRGEALYICNDKKKWHSNYTTTSDDIYQENCDNHTIRNNAFGPNIGAEHIDIKEGTRGHNIHDNTFTAAITNSTLINATGDFTKSIVHDKGYNNRIHNNTFNMANMKWHGTGEWAAIRVEQVLDDGEYGANIYGHNGGYVYNTLTNSNQGSSDEYIVLGPSDGGNNAKVGCDTINGSNEKYRVLSQSKSGLEIDGGIGNTGASVVSGSTCDNYTNGAGGSSTSSTGSTSSTSGSTTSSSGGYSGSKNLPGKIQAQNYKAASDTSSGNSGGSVSCTYYGLNVDVQNTSDSSGTCNIGWTASNEWVEYKVGSAGGTYDIKLRLAANSTGKRVQVLVNGSGVGTVTASNNGWSGWHNKTISGKSIPSNATIRVKFLDGGVNLNYLDIVSSGGSSTSSTSSTGSTSSSGSAGYTHDMNSGSGLNTKHVTSSFSSGAGTFTLSSANNDPYVRATNIGINASTYTHVEFRVKNNTPGTAWRVYFNPGSGEGGNSVAKTVAQSGSYTTYSVDMTSDPDWSGTINAVRIDPQGSVSGTVVFDYIKVTDGGSSSSSSSSTGSTSSSGGGGCVSYTYDSGLKEITLPSGSGTQCITISGGTLNASTNKYLADSDANTSCDFRGTAAGSGGGSVTIDGNWENLSGLSGSTLNLTPSNGCRYLKLRVMQ